MTVPPPFVAPTAGVVVNSTLTLRPGLYTDADFVTPAGATCRVISESWILGQTTLLPARVTGI
ncbi:Wsc domain-containing protein [Colletotrichum higginsianum IMI 349063]|uniref:Wsc domain-containing protein n=1 Tax=Colletotrichum higginsianum (strain IMI 349063) TaxID=759273 RepID=A0A1B7YKT1_COLHI|nr:Wsc domain-containing protein [Colletotrichum higginsianum IMI 349063]OBR12488.1 Wsc domain-containing protein [Colletotrichum higginsianum IMI 349063]GJC94163.1 Wsc domain-containing protein [Colletotrichum higginsianum]